MLVPFGSWACPLDNHPMYRINNVLKCSQNHSYDYARQGYINLLPAQYKHSQSPGDNDIMVQARRDFLNTGLYVKIVDYIVQCVQQYQIVKHPLSDFCLVDAGCGEGYYTVHIADELEELYPETNISVMGFDISKTSICAATKRNKTRDWAVATNSHIPVQSQSVDCVLSLFGFPVIAEFKRLLKQGGLLITADVAPNHLIELRQCVYDTVTIKSSDVVQINDTQIHLLAEVPVSYTISNLSFETVDSLLKMTPHFYRMPNEKYDQFKTNFPRNITVSILLRIYTRG